jgi:O-antigen/teichoic acid export membrane protein
MLEAQTRETEPAGPGPSAEEDAPIDQRGGDQQVPSVPGVVLQLATARGIAIAISFGTAPIIGRLYSPNAYGILGVFATLLSILAAFASACYVFAIPIAATTAERRDLFVLCSLIGLGTTVMVTVSILIGADQLAAHFHEPDLAKYVVFFPFLFLGNAIRELLDTTLSCQRRFGAVALRNVLEIVVGRLVQLGACLVGLIGSAAGLIMGSLAGNYVSALSAGATSVRDVFRTAREPLCLAGLRAASVKHRKFALIEFPAQTVSAVTFGLPAMILGMQFSVEIVGLYGMAYTMVTLPLQLFTASANQVFYVEVADRIARRSSAVPTAQQLVRVLTALTSFPLTVVLVVGPLLFTTFLGPKWLEAGVFAQILVPWMALMAISSPLCCVYQVLNRQGENFIWNIMLLVARFAALYFGSMIFGARGALGIFVFASVVIVVCLTFRSLSLLGVSRTWAAGVIAGAYVKPLLLLAPAGIAYWCFAARLASLVALGAASLVYCFMLCRRHPQLLQHIVSHLPGSWARWLCIN